MQGIGGRPSTGDFWEGARARGKTKCNEARLCSHGGSSHQVCGFACGLLHSRPHLRLLPTMPTRKVHKKSSKTPSYVRLTPLAKGRIIGLREKGAERTEIASTVLKKDGTQSSLKTIGNVLSRFAEDPEWDGCEAGGRPRLVTPEQEARITAILLKDVGKYVVSAAHVKRFLKDLRGIPDRTIQRAFQRLGYAYLYRRGKSSIGDKYKPTRMAYCKWLLQQDQNLLNKFAYIDGTTCFRPRTEEERQDKQRASLGPRGWRLEDGSDSLEDQNVGGSGYAKSQGKPIKIWGAVLQWPSRVLGLAGRGRHQGQEPVCEHDRRALQLLGQHVPGQMAAQVLSDLSKGRKCTSEQRLREVPAMGPQKGI